MQLGTAREIIANPVDDYVADFVAHMNPLGVFTAADLSVSGQAAAGAPVVGEDTSVREVMALLTDHEEVALSSGGKITRQGVIAKLIDPRA